MRLFTYCIPIDDGAAPNPFWGVCTLAICKPVIGRVAEVGDWVVGIGSKNVEGEDYSGKLVYAMRVTDKMTMPAYEDHCKQNLVEKISDIDHRDYRRRLGDSIYSFNGNTDGYPSVLKSVHNEENRKTDLGGKHVLLSDDFYYFGKNAIEIPEELKGVVKQGQGHKSDSNAPFALPFIDWVRNLDFKSNEILGMPQLEVQFDERGCLSKCSTSRRKSAEKDETLIIKSKDC